MNPWLIVTDLDGTLLDHHDYSFEAASASLQDIRALNIPLILASSKTRAEILQLQTELQIDYPFICENGAAICAPRGEELEVEALGPPRAQVLECLASLRDLEGYKFTGFADAGVDEMVAMTGLSIDAVKLSIDREYTEPILWQDSAQQLIRFREQLATSSLQALQGGRFLSIGGFCDKASAIQRLGERYGGIDCNWLIVLGDSPNDESMLALADVAVIVRSARSEELQLPGAQRFIRTTATGPAGWQQAMSALLTEYKIAKGNN